MAGFNDKIQNIFKSFVFVIVTFNMYSQLPRCCTARESSTRSSLVFPAKVKARKSLLSTESSLLVWNKELLVDFVVALYFTSICCNALHSSKVSQPTLNEEINITVTSVWNTGETGNINCRDLNLGPLRQQAAVQTINIWRLDSFVCRISIGLVYD